MGLRDPLVPFNENEDDALAYLERAFTAAKEAGGSGRLRLEIGSAFSLVNGKSYASVSLWVERGSGRAESWQRVTPTITGDTYEAAFGPIVQKLDEQRKAGKG